MDSQLAGLARELEKNPGASELEISEVEGQIGVTFPRDYREFIRDSNGAEGKVGPVSHLQLWAVGEIPKLNTIARVADFAPGLVLFGSDGGSMSYAFDIRVPNRIRFVEVSDVPMSLDEVRVLGDTFGEFLEHLAKRL